MISERNFNEWWERNSADYDAVFFDIDGTLISGGRALPGAAELIGSLRGAGFPFKLLTNDGNHSVDEKSAIMRGRGLDVDSKDIVSCGMALDTAFAKFGLKGKEVYAMGLLGTPDFAELAGAIPVRAPERIGECAAVVVGEGTYNWQENISAVINYFIAAPDRMMLVPNPDSYWPNGKNGGIGVGAGGKARFVKTILHEYGVKIKPVYLGKPYKPVYRRATRALRESFPDLPKTARGKRILMLGDSLFSDIRGAVACGFSAGLVLTGVTSLEQARMAKPSRTPDFVFEKLGA